MTEYGRQWARINALYQRRYISPADLKDLAARHRKWFAEQHLDTATAFMTQDLKVYADHLEQFGERQDAAQEISA